MTRTTEVPPKPTVIGLAAASPNPFSLQTVLSFSLAQSGPVKLEIFSVDGRRVRSLVQGAREAGEHRVTWDGRDEAGQPVQAGIYYARLSTAHGEFRRRIVHLP